jgi:hypothetical protein
VLLNNYGFKYEGVNILLVAATALKMAVTASVNKPCPENNQINSI